MLLWICIHALVCVCTQTHLHVLSNYTKGGLGTGAQNISLMCPCPEVSHLPKPQPKTTVSTTQEQRNLSYKNYIENVLPKFSFMKKIHRTSYQDKLLRKQ